MQQTSKDNNGYILQKSVGYFFYSAFYCVIMVTKIQKFARNINSTISRTQVVNVSLTNNNG